MVFGNLERLGLKFFFYFKNNFEYLLCISILLDWGYGEWGIR